LTTNRPKANLKLTLIDWVLEAICLLSIVGIWLLTLVSYWELPEIIPIHYNITGDVDSFGRKINILSLPVISTIIYIALTILNKYPHTFNYSHNLTEENASAKYRITTQIIRIIKLISIFTFTWLVWETIQYVNENTERVKFWYNFIPLVFFLIPIIYILLLITNKTK